MKNVFAILLALFCVTCISSVSGDCYRGSGQCIDPCVGQCDEGHFYVGAFGGGNWLNISRIEGVKLRTKLGFTGGASIGYKFDNGFRIEGEVAYRRNDLNTKHLAKKYSFDCDKASGSFYNWSYMVNFLYDFDQVSCLAPEIVPYVGVGLGYTQNHSHIKGYGEKLKYSDSGFAYQGIAGVGYRLTDSTTLAVEYRYFRGDKKAQDHSVALAIRQAF